MSEPLPVVMIPGLLATPRLYAEQIPAIWRVGPVTIADHTREDSMSAIAGRILASAPRRFALVGLSMGGYLSFEILRQAAERVVKLALLDTTARPDTPEQTEGRRNQIALARSGRFADIPDLQFPRLVHAMHRNDEGLRKVIRQMAEEIGPEAFECQQVAILNRPDSRPDLHAIRCPTLMIVGDGDELTPPDRAAEIASGIPGAQLVTIPKSGHLSTLEQPRAVTEVLLGFLRS